jgi:hypothetical protein
MERRSINRSSSDGSEKMERFGDRSGNMERYCSTGQSSQRAVAPTEEEEVNHNVILLVYNDTKYSVRFMTLYPSWTLVYV